jgi:hypothetical protein
MKYLRNKLHQQLYRENYERWQESLRLGLLEHHRKSAIFPSTVEGGRGAVSQLGGVAVEKSEKGSRP